MKKILQIFPNGVLITPNSSDLTNHYFTNEVFEKSIYEIRNRLDELDKVKVVYKSTEGKDESKSIHTNLLKLLQSQQQRIRDENSVVETNAMVQEKLAYSNSQRFEEDELHHNEGVVEDVQRSYDIKSQIVEFEGINCFMHVFIDTTDILKLEEAKRNIE